MEKSIDYFNFLSGGKLSVPFDAFLVFSTTLRPEQIGDGGVLQRIQYKKFMRSPEEREFLNIFERYCDGINLPIEPGVLNEFIDRRYRSTKKMLRRCHPRDIVSHGVDLIHFVGKPYKLTFDVLDEAFESTFVSEAYED